jgi:hypothetical protein
MGRTYKNAPPGSGRRRLLPGENNAPKPEFLTFVCGDATVDRANIRTRAALVALFGVDDVDGVAFRDRFLRTLGDTRSARDAVFSNLVCHFTALLLIKAFTRLYPLNITPALIRTPEET